MEQYLALEENDSTNSYYVIVSDQSSEVNGTSLTIDENLDCEIVLGDKTIKVPLYVVDNLALAIAALKKKNPQTFCNYVLYKEIV